MTLFRNGTYRRLWIGQSVSQIGDFVFATTAMLWLASLLAGRSYAPAVSSASLVISAALAVLLAPVAGVFVDRWNKIRVALATDVIRAVVGVLFVGLPLLVTVAPLWCVLVVAGIGIAVEAAAALFFNPARFVIVTDVVPEEQRGQAAGMTQASTAIATIVGPSVAAVVFVNVGPALSFAINAATFLLSYLMIRGVPRPEAGEERFPAQAQSLRRELLAPLRVIAGQPTLRMLVTTGVVVMLGAGALNALDVYFVAENLHAGPQWYGFISAAFGFGVLAGALVTGLVGDRLGYRRLLAGCLIGGGLIYLGYSRLHTPLPAVAAIALYGFVGGCVETSLSPLILGSVSRDLLARVISVFGPAFRLASIVSITSAAWLVSLLRPGQTVHIAGIDFNRIELVFTATSALIVAAGVYAATAKMRASQRLEDSFTEHTSAEPAGQNSERRCRNS